jgi:hypothetical protein
MKLATSLLLLGLMFTAPSFAQTKQPMTPKELNRVVNHMERLIRENKIWIYQHQGLVNKLLADIEVARTNETKAHEIENYLDSMGIGNDYTRAFHQQ